MNKQDYRIAPFPNRLEYLVTVIAVVFQWSEGTVLGGFAKQSL